MNARLRWHTPATDYPNKRYGGARIFKYRCAPKHYYWAEGMKGLLFYQFEPGHNKVTQLNINGVCWMTDMPPYYWSMEHFATQAMGRVLVAGLGLGLIAHCLVKNPAVTTITIIEKEPDVINLIKPLLPVDPRIEIINQEFYGFMALDQEKRDTVIWDLGLWSLVDGEDTPRENMGAMFIIKDQVQDKYGEECLCFRHGLDRDPQGAAFVKTERYQKAMSAFRRGAGEFL